MKRSTLTIGFYLTLVFASGVAVGSFGQYLRDAKSVSAKTNNPQEDYKKKYLSEMGSRLKLSGAQRQALLGVAHRRPPQDTDQPVIEW